MSRRYYNPLPDWNIPSFLKKRFLGQYIKKMIEWSTKEYNDAVRIAAEHGAFRFVKFLTDEYSPMKILAECDEFKEIISILSGMTSIQISARERSFIRKSYQLSLALGK